MSLEKELREACTDLAFDDEAAAEVVLRFVQIMNDDLHVQSASSMILNLGKALVEVEEAEAGEDQEPDSQGN
jgi:hypothetical protein